MQEISTNIPTQALFNPESRSATLSFDDLFKIITHYNPQANDFEFHTYRDDFDLTFNIKKDDDIKTNELYRLRQKDLNLIVSDYMLSHKHIITKGLYINKDMLFFRFDLAETKVKEEINE